MRPSQVVMEAGAEMVGIVERVRGHAQRLKVAAEGSPTLTPTLTLTRTPTQPQPSPSTSPSTLTLTLTLTLTPTPTHPLPLALAKVTAEGSVHRCGDFTVREICGRYSGDVGEI